MSVDPLSASRAFGHRATQVHLWPSLPPIDKEGERDQPIGSALGTTKHRRAIVPLPHAEFRAVDDQ